MRRGLHSSILFLLALLPCSALAAAKAGPGEPAAANPAYRISGTVVDSRDGSPIAQCRVSAAKGTSGNSPASQTQTPSGAIAGSAARLDRAGGGGQRRGARGESGAEEVEPVMTDRRGQFSLIVQGAGVWRLTGRAKGYRAQSYDQHEPFWSGVVLTAAVPEMALTLRLTPDAVITGIVFDEAGEAVRNAQIRVEPVRTPGPNEGLRGAGNALNATTDDRGNYEVPGLQPGKYRLKVNAQPWYASSVARSSNSPDRSLDVVYAETWYPAASDADGAEVIAINGGEHRQADFHLVPMPSIHLHIPISPQAATPPDGEERARNLREPIVSREDSAGGLSSVTATVVNGKDWDVGGLTPGNYQVRTAGDDGGGQKVSQLTIPADSAAVVGLGSASTATTVSFTVDGVEDSEVRQITLVDVASRQSFRTKMRRERRGAGDEDEDEESGVRRVTAPLGRYEVYLNGSRGLYLGGLTATGAKVTGRTLEIAGGSPKVMVHGRIGEGEVDGVARREGKVVGGAMVLLVPAGYGRMENVAPVERDETNTDGSFSVSNVIPGEYILLVIDHGWDVNWRDSATLAQYLASGTPINLAGSATVRKEVQATVP